MFLSHLVLDCRKTEVLLDRDIFYKATLSLFCLSSYGDILNTRSKILRVTFDGALLMENHVLDEAFSYAVCIDCNLFISWLPHTSIICIFLGFLGFQSFADSLHTAH